jgi:BASS family bile acid:Na+ symporter
MTCAGSPAALMTRFVEAFPLWITLGAALALAYPPLLAWVVVHDLVTPGLQVIMLGMGLTLTVDDFARVGRRPAAALTGLVLQYAVMPAAGVAAGRVFDLPPAYAAGVILVCCAPGGTASNVITYLARGDVALSVTMTSLSTMVAVVATPMLTTWLVGSRVEMDAAALFRATAEVILGPVVIGLVLRRFLPRLARQLVRVAPAAAVAAIVLIVGGILAVQRAQILSAGPVLLASVATAHTIGFATGYVLSRFHSVVVARTISIEVGMQNSGLAVVLARASFSDPLVAVPCAISSVFHSIMGSGLAAVWSRRPPQDECPESPAREENASSPGCG